MIRNRIMPLFVILALCLLSVAVVSAQDDSGPTVVIYGLVHPRGMSYDADGNLYIAEGGNGGDRPSDLPDAFGNPAMQGTTSQITFVAPDGFTFPLLPDLPSFSTEGLGAQRVLIDGDTMWLLFSEGPLNVPFNYSAVALDLATFRVKHFIDLYTYEREFNPDNSEEFYNNPNDIDIASDGTVWIVDAGGNTIFTWTPETGLVVFKAWDTNPVPTSLDFGEDGSIWVSFLGQQLAPGAGSVQHLDASGEIIETYEGLTTVTDVLVAEDGTVYFVEMFREGESPEVPAPGAISAITEEGVSVVVDNLFFPFALAQSPSGDIVVSQGTVTLGPEPAPGSVVLAIPAE